VLIPSKIHRKKTSGSIKLKIRINNRTIAEKDTFVLNCVWGVKKRDNTDYDGYDSTRVVDKTS